MVEMLRVLGVNEDDAQSRVVTLRGRENGGFRKRVLLLILDFIVTFDVRFQLATKAPEDRADLIMIHFSDAGCRG